jgi:hypothetical protein
MPATNTDQSPFSTLLTARMPAVAAGSDADSAVCRAPFAGTVTAVTYVPDATITGAATNNRTLSLRNKGQAGVGTTVVASLNFANGTNATGYDETALTLSVVADATLVAAGDVLALQSLHVGTGIADPGGLAVVTFSRA